MNYYYSSFNRNTRPGPKNWLKKFWQAIKELIKNKLFKKSVFKRFFKWGVILVLLGMVLGVILFITVSFSLPDPNKLNSRIVAQSTKIYARDGTTLLYEIHGEAKRTLIKLNAVPDYVKQATIAVEDKNFYKNPGIEWTGILRAIWVDITRGDLKQGGSTITQQFVRNAILTREKTFIRKIKEIVLAIELEQKFTKDEILQMYLNEIPYGQNAYGIQAAAQTYFAKNAKDLTLAESAYLTALPQAPTFYTPNGPNKNRLEARKNLILQLMEDQNYIDARQRQQAQDEKVVFQKIKDNILAPHFVLYVQALLAEKYGEKTLEEGGLNVVTTIDWDLQQIAEKAVKDGAARNKKSNKASNASLVAIDPKTGQILAMVGSPDFFDEKNDGQVNMAIRELQPGSSFKPYVYAAAFKNGMNPATMLVDVQTVFGTYAGKEYAPNNYDSQSHGILSMRKALAGSLNIPAVKTLALTGVKKAIDTAKDMGITSNINADRCGLALVLGGCEVNLLDHVSAFGVFANNGIRQEKTPILKISDNKGNILEEYKNQEGAQALDPQISFLVTSILTDNDARTFVFGPKSPLILSDRIVAAKTGTTQGWRDGWTLGFTPSLVAGVWVGNNNYTPMRQGADGVVVAAPIWNQFMREALKDTTPEQFTEPTGIQHIVVDSLSGKLPTDYSPSTKIELFAESNLPKDFDDVHVPIKINKLNGKLATAQTPADLVETKVFTVIRSEMPDNPNWEIPVEVWAVNNSYPYPPTELDDGSAFSLDTLIKKVNPKFITPANGQEITSVPFTAQVDPGNTNVKSVDFVLEGQYIGSRTSAPYSFFISPIKNGFQTLATIVRLSNGDLTQNSIRVNINVPNPPSP